MEKKRKRGQKPDEEIAKRLLRVLRELLKDKGVIYDSLLRIYMKDYDFENIFADDRPLRTDLDRLRDLGLTIEEENGRRCIPPIGIKGLWRRTPIGGRLEEQSESKKRLASKVVDFLKVQEETVCKVMLGTGTTVYEVAKELLARTKEHRIRRVYTNNLLVLREFIHQKDKCEEKEFRIIVAPGALDTNTGSLLSDKRVDYLGGFDVDAVIACFKGLSREGFSTGYSYDSHEKRANLRPRSKKCRYVIIPLEWFKIGDTHELVKMRGKKGGQDILDFQPGRRYLIITDPPAGGKISGRKREVLEFWQEKGVEIVYAKK